MYRVQTEATFSEVNATLPSLLCRFVAPDQARQIKASIFTCLCNYNTEICGMAMAQTVVPVYTNSKHLPGPTISVGEPVPDHSWHPPTPVRVSFVPLSLPPLVMFQWGSPIRRRVAEALAIPELGLLDWGTHKM